MAGFVSRRAAAILIGLNLIVTPLAAMAGDGVEGGGAKPDTAELRRGLLATMGQIETVQQQPKRCCKMCRTSKACGDSCIARGKACTKSPGCACDARRD